MLYGLLPFVIRKKALLEFDWHFNLQNFDLSSL